MELIADGSRFEDGLNARGVDECDTRPKHHFYDPVYERGLQWKAVRGEESPNWALEDTGDGSGQEYSLKNAREYLYLALASRERDVRRRNFGLTFQTLGHVIHHLQDMAQPEHTRNDIHLNVHESCAWSRIVNGLLGDPSLYETYTNLHRGKSFFADQLVLGGYTTVTFPTAREFWTTGNERGLADFTNRNFLSKDTNFTLKADDTVALNTLYARPFSTGPSQTVPIQTLLQEDGACQVGGGGDGDCGNECGPPVELPPACGLVGEVVFYGSVVQDNYAGGAPVPNPRASTLSIFDQDLEGLGYPPIYYDDPDDPLLDRVEYQRLFTLNRFNFEYAYPHLIPKAVAYSAGLIDFIFRGRIEVLDVSDDDSLLTIEIKNVSGTQHLPKDGSFTLCYDTRLQRSAA